MDPDSQHCRLHEYYVNNPLVSVLGVYRHFLKFISTNKELPCREVTLFICPCPVTGGCGQTQAETKGKYLLFLK
jgi:hypothetical protein